MPTIRKNASKTAKKAAKKSTKKSTNKTTKAARKKINPAKKAVKKLAVRDSSRAPELVRHDEIEENIRIPLDGGSFLNVRISVAARPKVGPGNPPQFYETLMIKRIGEDRVLTISAEWGRGVAAAIRVGEGPPVADN